jgi:LCP family protein required for cell wall assembly
MYDNVPATVPKNILGKTDNLGADVLKLSVGEAIGLKIDYYVLIDLAGFKKLIDALGGITVNINTYVAIGGSTDEHRPPNSWLHPGANQHLNGAKALWFARGRYGADDFQRMDRQRCVVDAIIQQANPANVLTRYEAIALAG